MALNKRTYVDQETVITAQNLNDIQDEIIANGTAIAGKIGTAEKGASGGVAELDQTGKVPSSQLPSYVDDVVEYDSLSEFPATGEAGKIYVAKDTNKTYRWGGSDYVEISESLALGETSTTAYRGDRGKTAYDDSQTNKTNIGTMSSLTTTEKGTLVGAINEVNSGKVDKVTGKGLSTEDYTTAEKTKLSGVQAEATKTVIDNTLTNAGQAADAKKTGDEISGIKNTILSHKADVIYDNASGDIASFPDGADGMPVKDLTVDIEPVHDTSGGDPSPTHICPISGRTGMNVTRIGKNALPTFVEVPTVDGLNITVNNGKLIVSGTISSTVTIDAPVGDFEWDGKSNFWLSGCPAGGSQYSGYSLRIDGESAQNYSAYDEGSGVALRPINNQITLRNQKLHFRIVLRAGTYNNLTFATMLNPGLSAEPYAPYSGCAFLPISWQSTAGTVYGGTLDALAGKLKTRPYYASYNGETLVGDRKSVV